MKTSARAGRPPSSGARGRARAAGALLVAALLATAAAFGGVVPEGRGLAHLLVAAALLAAAALPDRALARAGALQPVAVGFGALALAVLIGLLPLPRALLAVLAPATAAAHEHRAVWTLSLLPERTADELALFVLLLGVGLAAGAWAVVRGRRTTVERAVLASCALLVAVAGAHHLAGATDLFGVLPSGLAPGRFFAPFVDANHFGAAFVLGLPVVLGVVERERVGAGAWIAGGVVGAVGLWLLLASGSRGGAAGLVVAMGALAGSRGGRLRATSALVAAVAVGVLAFGAGHRAAGWSLDVRPLAWRAALDGLPGAWFAGSGGGTVSAVVDRHRRDATGYAWGHLHADPLEWLVETGLVGLVALAVAAAALAPRPSTDPRAKAWTLGLLALGVNSLVEFPLQVPAIAMAAAALLVCRRIVFGHERPARPGRIRALLLAAALLQPVGAAWTFRTGLADRAARDALAWHDDADRGRSGAERLRRLAPWRSEAALVAGWEAAARGRWEEAAAVARALRVAHAHDPTALRNAAALAAGAGHRDDALEMLDRAERLAPRDWRTAVARARLASPEEAVERWRAAFANGAPPRFLDEAWEALPVGVVWVDALADAPGYRQVALARMLERQGDVESALLAWERARMLDGRGPPSNGHVTALLRAGRLDEAHALAREALLHRADDPALLEQLAAVHLARGDTETATSLLLRAGDRRPSARVQALRTVAAEGGTGAALDLVRRLELVGVESAELRLELARLYAEEGDRAACLRQVDRAELAASGRHDEALRRMRARCRGER